MPTRRRFLTSFALLAAAGRASSGAWAADGVVAMILSEEAPVYREAAAAIEAAAATAGLGATFRTLSGDDVIQQARGTQAVVAIGTRALDIALTGDPRIPVVAVLVPSESYSKRLGGADARRATAVFIDQPLARQLALVTIALPEKRTVGVVAGPSSQRQLAALSALAAARGLELVAASVASEREVFPALERIIGDAEVLLALPDPLVFNAGTIQNILLASYRRQVPMVGFSPAYLRAGALVTLQSAASQIAASAVDGLRAALAGRPLPPARFPREFSVTVNRHVARSLGLRIGDDAELAARLQATESGR